ncbi:hypothetical protein PO124_21275 [Bacillus licheniformis]|nr:hypothetical protein [Bacillus licheniformis]
MDVQDPLNGCRIKGKCNQNPSADDKWEHVGNPVHQMFIYLRPMEADSPVLVHPLFCRSLSAVNRRFAVHQRPN